MDKHNIVIITDKSVDDCSYIDRSVFDISIVHDPNQLLTNPPVATGPGVLLVTDYSHIDPLPRELYHQVRDIAHELGLPLVAIFKETGIEHKLKGLEMGYQDIISPDQVMDEITTRFLREIYHSIANRQLKQQLTSASDAALAAMRESSNLGNNVHFLVQTHQCSNLDELGQMFFQSMKAYGLNCSLQMRSVFGEKNMEANGMPRQLESDLLTQLKDAGRYYDFGQRTVMNYGCVSVLIRNMPDDEKLYGLVKDNTFTLLQGLEARVRALDEHEQLAREKRALEHLSGRVNQAMEDVNVEYQTVMRGIVEVVENMAERISDRIPILLLNEEQEQFIEQTITDCVLSANQVFSEGFKVDTFFHDLHGEIEKAIELTQHKTSMTKAMPVLQLPVDDFHDVELF